MVDFSTSVEEITVINIFAEALPPQNELVKAPHFLFLDIYWQLVAPGMHCLAAAVALHLFL